MKYPYYDPETNKEYDCDNEYEFRIKSFTEKDDHNFWDDEVIEYAISLPNVLKSDSSNVAPGIDCTMTSEPLGVVAGITPFNFPVMVPLWMIPLAITTGNTFILKPSEQTPLAGIKLAEYLKEAGLPNGVFNVVNGGKTIVEALCDHPDIKALASKVSKNSLSFFVVVSNPPLVASSSFL